MNDHDPTPASAPSPPPGLSRRAVIAGTAGVAAAAIFGNASGILSGVTGSASTGAAPAEAASGTPVEPRHGAGEWTEDPTQANLSQSTTPVTGDIAVMPLDRSL